jgi:hypothetical protein
MKSRMITLMHLFGSLVILDQVCISISFSYNTVLNHRLLENDPRQNHRKKKTFHWFTTSFVDKRKLLAHPRNEQEDTDEKNPLSWTYISEIARIQSPWITIVAEHFKNENSDPIDYWRIERPDSAIVIVLHKNMLIFPKAQYRPGINEVTLDFCGGRVPFEMEGEPIRAVPRILEKELGFRTKENGGGNIKEYEITSLNINGYGWPVDSSVSSQKLFGFLVTIRDDVELDENFLHERKVNVENATDMNLLLSKELKCLQCRSLLMELILQNNGKLN